MTFTSRRIVALRPCVTLALLLAAAALRAQATPAPRPRAPYVTAACPFECCTYGAWRFVTGAPLRSRPRAEAPIVGRLGVGERVRADSGHVRLDTLGRVLVRRDFRDPDAGAEYRAGDTLLVLDYLGEGFSHVWVRGERRQLTLVDVLSLHGPPAGPDTAAMLELQAPSAQWWAHVTRPARMSKKGPSPKGAGPRVGWVHMTSDVDVRGADACGGPEG